MLPELGGRIQRAYDKTNGYDFIYYNHVIKPALVGLAGPWISGGIEFNWPQHHRPSTFDPVEYTYAENEDGSATVWMGEIENMFRTEGVLGVTLYPDKAYIELSAKLYNRTKVPQTFLWWANPAVAVNDDTISVFPEDVTAVYDHGKRDVISFPYAEGIYYKHKYDHVNIAQYKIFRCRLLTWHTARIIILSVNTTMEKRPDFCTWQITTLPPGKTVDLGMRRIWQGMGQSTDRRRRPVYRADDRMLYG